MRHPCLQEDEKMPHLIKVVDTKKEAEDWIKEQEGEYFKPSDYYIGKIYEPRG
jgi:hypothetical protein